MMKASKAEYQAAQATSRQALTQSKAVCLAAVMAAGPKLWAVLWLGRSSGMVGLLGDGFG